MTTQGPNLHVVFNCEAVLKDSCHTKQILVKAKMCL